MTSPTRSRGKTIGIWAVCVLMGAFFLSAAAMKLSGAEMEAAAFNEVGLG